MPCFADLGRGPFFADFDAFLPGLFLLTGAFAARHQRRHAAKIRCTRTWTALTLGNLREALGAGRLGPVWPCSGNRNVVPLIFCEGSFAANSGTASIEIADLLLAEQVYSRSVQPSTPFRRTHP